MQSGNRTVGVLRNSALAPEERPFGLRVLHEPHVIRSEVGTSSPRVYESIVIELIFVHGLGGSRMGTWTHPGSNAFWPSWLHDDTQFSNVRISTFGYDSEFKNIRKPQNALGIADFANQLLNSLDVHVQKHGEVETFTEILT